MGDYDRKAADLVAKADKKLKPNFLGLGIKYEDAAELLEKAGNQYKLAKNFKAAGDTFGRLAEVHLKLDSKHEAASAYVEAGKAYGKVDKGQAMRALHKAIEFYTEMGRIGMAARNLREVAETQEKQGSRDEAVVFWDQAAELFESDHQTSEGTKCRLKAAHISAELERYPPAIEAFEAAAKAAVDNNLLKYSAKGYLLNAGICQLCTGKVEPISSMVERYEDIDLNFGGSREHSLLKGLADAFEQGDEQAFTDAIAEFDSVQRLEPWRTSLLLRVKKRLTTHGGGDDIEEEDLT
eukprot:jgi/Astpho2/1419/e_gw1.00025.77.1_t